ncbi:MAG: PQQ-binding-like beta-propeller repeat protein [Planctomycetota bacterium]
MKRAAVRAAGRVFAAVCLLAAGGTGVAEEEDFEGAGRGGYASRVGWAEERLLTTRYRRAVQALAEGDLDSFAEIADSVFASPVDAMLPRRLAETPTSVKWATSRLFAGEAVDRVARAAAYEDFDLLASGYDVTRLERLRAGDDFAYRFADTPAGIAAYDRAATRRLDRGDPLGAAVGFAMLERTPRAASSGGEGRRRRAAWAWRMAGADGGDAAAGLPVVDADAFAAGPVGVWASRFGGADGPASVPPVSIVGGPAWQIDLAKRPLPGIDLSVRWLMTTEATLRTSGHTDELARLVDMPVARPLAFGGKVYARMFDRVVAFDAATGAGEWVSTPLPVGIASRVAEGIVGPEWYDPDGDDRRLMIPGRRSYDPRLAFAAQRAWLDATAGGLSGDGRYVYAVEGCGMTERISPVASVTSAEQLFGNDETNFLVGYDTRGAGRIALLAGGAAFFTPRPTDAPAPERPLDGVFFLGPPTAADGRLYVLGIKASELRLYGLRPRPRSGDFLVEFAQPLLVPENDIRIAPLRRLSGVSPAVIGGLVVCPTTSGAVMAYDPQRRRVVWATAYRTAETIDESRPGNLILSRRPMQSKPVAWLEDAADRWVDTVVASDGPRVLVTPRDGDELLCLSLVDGERLWSRPRGDALYVDAVSGGRCLIVGRDSVRAVDTEAGSDAWPRPAAVPQPCGRGVRVGDVYHLPTVTNEIWTVSLEDGRVLAIADAGRPVGPDGEPASVSFYGDSSATFATGPGQLIAAGGRLIAQSLFGLRAWPRRDGPVDVPEDGDASSLAAAGRALLHDGEVDEAFRVLRRSIDLEPSGPAREPYVRAVISAAARGNDEAGGRLEALITASDDPRLRAELLWTVCETHFDDGDAAAGAMRLIELASLAVEPVVRLDPSGRPVREDRQIRRRAVDRDLTEQEEARFSAAVAEAAERVAAGEDDVSLRRFLASLGHEPAAWPAVEAAVARRGRPGDASEFFATRLLRRLSLSPDGSVAGRALAAMTSAGLSEAVGRDAAAFGDTSFGASVKVSPMPPWGAIPVELTGRGVGDDGTFEVDADRVTLRGRDRFGRVRLVAQLRSDDESVDSRAESAGLVGRVDGRVAVFSLGWRSVAFDLAEPGRPRRLWEAATVPPGRGGDIDARPGFTYDGRQRFTFLERRTHRPIDAIRVIGSDFVAYRRGDELRAVDIETGGLLWSASGVPDDGVVYGDDRHVVVVTPDGRDADGRPSPVFDAVDGRRVDAVSLPSEAARTRGGGRTGTYRIARDGVVMVTWSPGSTKSMLRAFDVTRGTTRWSWSFTSDAVPTVVSAGREVAVLSDGVFSVVRIADGELVCEVAMPGEPEPAQDGLTVFSTPGRYVVFTATADRPRDAVSGGRNRRPVFGPFAVVTEGGDGWGVTASGTLEMARIASTHPAGLPVAVFDSGVSGERTEAGRRLQPIFRVKALDLRTGEIIIDEPIGPAIRAPGPVVGDPDDGSVLARFATARLDLKQRPGDPASGGREPSGGSTE